MRRQDAPEVPWPRVHAFRLRRHRLAPRAGRGDLAEVAGDACGVQAQILSAARLALRARTRGLRPTDVDRALLRNRTLVGVWCMRDTRHLVPSRDFAVFSRGVHHIVRRWTSWFDRHRLPPEAIEPIVDSIVRALDRPRTRDEVLELVSADLGIPKRAKRMSRGWGNVAHTEGLAVRGHVLPMSGMMGYACIRGLACCVANDGQDATFVRPDAWIPDWRDLTIPEAEREFVRRYLRSYGPATPEDFAFWAGGFPLRSARAIWAGMGDGLSEVRLDGRPAWVLREDLPALRAAKVDGPVVRLLPYFDTYLLGHRDRAHLVDAAHYRRVYRPAAWIAPVVLVDGRCAGVWSHKKARDRIDVRVEPFSRMSRAVREGIAAEADDVGRFLGGAVNVQYAEPS